ncbi:MAG TPA: twin-arginine translocase subunit TatC [Solirubrobacteraceae bacterium]|nr:twin-arginine translocase subunit TatC [Solirubrobacteraceae bacterium]
MRRAIRPVGHDDHLSLVEHLDELRTRLIISLAALLVAFGFCFWQNHALLKLIGNPYAKETRGQVEKCQGELGQIWCADKFARKEAIVLRELAGTNPRPVLKAAIAAMNAAERDTPSSAPGNNLITIGIGEPFTATITVTFYFALLIALPLLLFQIYGFVIPAFSPTERRVALPVMLSIPGLFACGVLFAYFVVLPAAVHFLQNFNSGSFEQFVQASSYYSFAALIMLAMGVIFQVPLAVIAITRAGIVTPRQLRKNRRYAIVVAALIAAVLPGDVVTMLLETLPIIVLYEVGILVVTVMDRRDARRARTKERLAAAANTMPPPAPPPIP